MSDKRAGDATNRLDQGQVGGDHYSKLSITPWQALEAWLTPVEFRGYLKGEAIVYLARELSKAGPTDVSKARHTLQKLEEVYTRRDVEPPVVPPQRDTRDPAKMSAAELACIPLPPIRVEAATVPGYVFVNGHVYELHKAQPRTTQFLPHAGGCTVPEVCAANGGCAKPGTGCPWEALGKPPAAGPAQPPAPAPAGPPAAG